MTSNKAISMCPDHGPEVLYSSNLARVPGVCDIFIRLDPSTCSPWPPTSLLHNVKWSRDTTPMRQGKDKDGELLGQRDWNVECEREIERTKIKSERERGWELAEEKRREGELAEAVKERQKMRDWRGWKTEKRRRRPRSVSAKGKFHKGWPARNECYITLLMLYAS